MARYGRGIGGEHPPARFLGAGRGYATYFLRALRGHAHQKREQRPHPDVAEGGLQADSRERSGHDMSQTESDRSGKETESARAREAERKRPKTSRRAAHYRRAHPYAPQRRAATARNVGLFSGPRRFPSRRACSLPQESPGVLPYRAPERLSASRTEGAQGIRFLFPLFQPRSG